MAHLYRRSDMVATEGAQSMPYSRKTFCVLATGRAGSTLLMKALKKFEDVAVPNKNVVCPDEELLHPAKIA